MMSFVRPHKSIAYARHHIDADDIAAVDAILRSDWLTSGPAVVQFETAVAQHCGSRFAVAVSSATAALHTACNALGVGPGDRVWTSPNSFVSSANCALYCGADIDFVDIDPHSYNISPPELERKLETAKKSGTLPKVLVVVHFGGRPCDLADISALARGHGVAIIEDASHALGATYRGEPIGACSYSDATVFSFHAIKTIATGEGGMVLTNRAAVSESAARFRSHGIIKRSSEDEPWRYDQIELGFNYRMTEMQAALGVSQLAKMGQFIARRAALAKRYDEALKSTGLQLPLGDGDSTSVWHLYPVQIVSEDRVPKRRHLYEALRKAGIAPQVHYIPIHTQPYYRARGFCAGDFPVAEAYYQGALSLPLFFGLSDDEQDRVIEVVRTALGSLH
jgi:UDP-4-amino-4,6-dideoxy-N-acetyl-beta-L-altrosamine transaminase